jgi:hypothetical protein
MPYIALNWDGKELTMGGAITPIFYPALTEFYTTQSFAILQVNNTTDEKIKALRLEVTVEVNDAPVLRGIASELEALPLKTAATKTEVEKLNRFPLRAIDINRTIFFNNRAETVGNASITVDFNWNAQAVHKVFKLSTSIQSINAFDAANPWMLAAYINPSQPDIVSFVRQVLSNHPDANENWEQAAIIFDALVLYGMRYQYDPTSRWASGGRRSLDTIFLPSETFSYRQGDCDDLSVLYATALESVGIPTRLVFGPQHVWVAFAPYDTALSVSELRQVLHMEWNKSLSDYSFAPLDIPLSEIHDKFNDEYLWIPVETTLLGPPRYSFLGIKGVGWIRNNFTAAVQAGREQMRLLQTDIESYSTKEIHRDLGARPASLIPQTTTVSALPHQSEVAILYQTEMWQPGGTRFLVFMRRNWFWAIPALLLGIYMGFRTLSAIVARGYDGTKEPSVDPEEVIRQHQVHEVVKSLQEYKQCPRCGTPLLRTTLICVSCGLGVCRCGGVIDPGTRECQVCGTTYTIRCPQCGNPVEHGQYVCGCGATLCTKCSGVVDINLMRCTQCGRTMSSTNDIVSQHAVTQSKQDVEPAIKNPMDQPRKPHHSGKDHHVPGDHRVSHKPERCR